MGSKRNFALKLDMSKVYDGVEWDFRAVGVNEDANKLFWPSSELRQGDSLSPYPFLICAEGFSTLLNEARGSTCS
ncbi:hypothetical protein PVK06_049015 [Gossypium arboreum]|uniref:Reverse transcriptase n=1 Tax=Gossypium arboreum TaxID=29729 RepID=A0ABR0MHU6_GOSAR|nr:hypothetical protein PVK06_049015 [Gossypium arboreum]